MTNSRVRRGRASQELVAEWLRGHGYPKAESRPASLPGTDIMHAEGLACEVKATVGLDMLAALRQSEANAADNELPIVVYRPKGYGPEKLGDWVVLMSLRNFSRWDQGE